jgi:hypothetical protein
MSCYPIDHLNKLYENFPRELRYILDERIDELLNTLPEVTVTLKNKRFVLIDVNEHSDNTIRDEPPNIDVGVADVITNEPKYTVVPNTICKFANLVNHVTYVSPYAHVEPDYTKNIKKQFDIEETNSITHKESLNN